MSYAYVKCRKSTSGAAMLLPNVTCQCQTLNARVKCYMSLLNVICLMLISSVICPPQVSYVRISCCNAVKCHMPMSNFICLCQIPHDNVKPCLSLYHLTRCLPMSNTICPCQMSYAKLSTQQKTKVKSLFK